MHGLTAREISEVVGGELHAGPGVPGTGVAIDSRNVKPGDLFIALPGSRADGHDFLEAAAHAGASGALVSKAALLPPSLPGVVVADPLEALRGLARFQLSRLRSRVVGITGSVGKTTAKDFLRALLKDHPDPVFASPGSWNSEIGLPLSVLSAPPGTRTLVLEYGINAPGEMERLVATAPPDCAWVTAIGEAHLEGLQDLAGVGREKAFLPGAVSSGGKIWFGPDVDKACRGDWSTPPRALNPWDGTGGPQGEPGSWRVPGFFSDSVHLPLQAAHEAVLAWSAATIAVELGVDPARVDDRMRTLVSPPGRMSVHELKGGVRVLDDSYNSSPPALKAALETLAMQTGKGRKIAVLGTMRELGPREEEIHRGLGGQLKLTGVDLVVGVGKGGGWIADGAEARGIPTLRGENAESMGSILLPEILPGDCILLKASRAEGLEAVLASMLDWARTSPLEALEASR